MAGAATLRTPDGEQTLRPWDVAVFVRGEAGAHDVRNDGDEVVRVLLLSTVSSHEICVYPDSGTIGAGWTDPDGRVRVLRNRIEANVDYYEGELWP